MSKLFEWKWEPKASQEQEPVAKELTVRGIDAGTFSAPLPSPQAPGHWLNQILDLDNLATGRGRSSLAAYRPAKVPQMSEREVAQRVQGQGLYFTLQNVTIQSAPYLEHDQLVLSVQAGVRERESGRAISILRNEVVHGDSRCTFVSQLRESLLKLMAHEVDEMLFASGLGPDPHARER